ncbi:hypothetical protein NPIL_662341, partial [Nephila pilipes]
MDIYNCKVCNVTLEGTYSIISHRCWIKTNENLVEYENSDKNLIQNTFESRVSSMDSFAGSHFDTRLQTRNTLFQSNQNQNLTEIFEELSKLSSEHVEEPGIVNNILRGNHCHNSDNQRISDSNSEQMSAITGCSSRKQIFSGNEEPLNSFRVSSPNNMNSHSFPPNPIYSIQGRLKDVIPNDTGLLERASEKIPNFNTICSESLDRYSKRRKYILDRNISPILPCNTASASNTKVDKRLRAKSTKLQMFSNESSSNILDIEESETRNTCNPTSS